jgi:hypothetical protein
LQVIDDAFEALSTLGKSEQPKVILLELWLCRYAYDFRYQKTALEKVFAFLRAGIRCEGSNLVENIKCFKNTERKQSNILTALIQVACYNADICTLDALISEHAA